MTPQSKLPRVGTTIFTVMSQLAAEQGAINLGQGFPDFEGPQSLKDALARHTNGGRNQYAPMTGIPALRQEIARKTEFLYGCAVDAEREVTVTSGATEALFAAIAAMVRPGEEVIVFDPCYDSYEPAIELQGATAVRLALQAPEFGLPWDALAAAIANAINFFTYVWFAGIGLMRALLLFVGCAVLIGLTLGIASFGLGLI